MSRLIPLIPAVSFDFWQDPVVRIMIFNKRTLSCIFTMSGSRRCLHRLNILRYDWISIIWRVNIAQILMALAAEDWQSA